MKREILLGFIILCSCSLFAQKKGDYRTSSNCTDFRWFNPEVWETYNTQTKQWEKVTKAPIKLTDSITITINQSSEVEDHRFVCNGDVNLPNANLVITEGVSFVLGSSFTKTQSLEVMNLTVEPKASFKITNILKGPNTTNTHKLVVNGDLTVSTQKGKEGEFLGYLSRDIDGEEKSQSLIGGVKGKAPAASKRIIYPSSGFNINK